MVVRRGSTVLRLIFAGYKSLASQSPYPIIIVYSVASCRPHCTFGHICNFRDPSLVTFYFYELTHFFRLNEEHVTFHLRKNILIRLLTVNMKNCLTPQNSKMCYPILVTLLKMQSHYSHFSRANATPSSGTDPHNVL